MAMNSTASTFDKSAAGTTSLTDILRTILKPLASLRLTVGLLALSVFIIWAITLQQATLDIWELKNQHFSSAFVSVPAQTFLPAKWFPNAPQLDFNFIFPSGFTLIVAMLINLTSAHVLRLSLIHI